MVIGMMRMGLSVFAREGSGSEFFCKCNLFLFFGLE